MSTFSGIVWFFIPEPLLFPNTTLNPSPALLTKLILWALACGLFLTIYSLRLSISKEPGFSALILLVAIAIATLFLPLYLAK